MRQIESAERDIAVHQRRQERYVARKPVESCHHEEGAAGPRLHEGSFKLRAMPLPGACLDFGELGDERGTGVGDRPIAAAPGASKTATLPMASPMRTRCTPIRLNLHHSKPSVGVEGRFDGFFTARLIKLTVVRASNGPRVSPSHGQY